MEKEKMMGWMCVESHSWIENLMHESKQKNIALG